MKTRALILLSFISLLLPGLSAQTMGNYKFDEQQRWNSSIRVPENLAIIQNNNEVTIDVKALMNVLADRYVAVFNIRQAGETAVSVNDLMAARIENFTKDLATLGIPAENIYIDMISQVPVYTMEVEKKVFSKTYNEVPMGFELQKNIHITFTESGLLDEMIAMAARQEIYDFVKVEYYSTEHQQHFDTLRIASIALVNDRLSDYKALGFELDTANFIMADHSSVIYPISHYATYQAYSSVSVEEAARSKGLLSSSTFSRQPKNTTMYYNPPSYSQYDLVINPVINEPVIQYTYHLLVKYRIEPEKQVITNLQKEYYIMLPDGTIKKIDLK